MTISSPLAENICGIDTGKYWSTLFLATPLPAERRSYSSLMSIRQHQNISFVPVIIVFNRQFAFRAISSCGNDPCLYGTRPRCPDPSPFNPRYYWSHSNITPGMDILSHMNSMMTWASGSSPRKGTQRHAKMITTTNGLESRCTVVRDLAGSPRRPRSRCSFIFVGRLLLGYFLTSSTYGLQLESIGNTSAQSKGS